ncbi:MAG: hypothetical protein EXR81_02715 [Gammaproteobacteria bacterium]|nr:hypothetical protein [Gammaproteobacteria bacterium]
MPITTQAEASSKRILYLLDVGMKVDDYLYKLAHSIQRDWQKSQTIADDNQTIIAWDNGPGLVDRLSQAFKHDQSMTEICIVGHALWNEVELSDRMGHSRKVELTNRMGHFYQKFDIEEIANSFVTAIKNLPADQQNKFFKFTFISCFAMQPHPQDFLLQEGAPSLNSSLGARFLTVLAKAKINCEVTGSTGEIVPFSENNQLTVGIKNDAFRRRNSVHQSFTYSYTKKDDEIIYHVYPALAKENDWLYGVFHFIRRLVNHYSNVYPDKLTVRKLVCFRNRLIASKSTLETRDWLSTLPEICPLNDLMKTVLNPLLNDFSVKDVATYERAILGKSHPLSKQYYFASLWPQLFNDPELIYRKMNLTKENQQQRTTLKTIGLMIETHFREIELAAKNSIKDQKKDILDKNENSFILMKKMSEDQVLTILFIINYKRILPNFIYRYPNFDGRVFKEFFELDYTHTFRRLFYDINGIHVENAVPIDFSINKSFFSSQYEVKCLFSVIRWQATENKFKP